MGAAVDSVENYGTVSTTKENRTAGKRMEVDRDVVVFRDTPRVPHGRSSPTHYHYECINVRTRLEC